MGTGLVHDRFRLKIYCPANPGKPNTLTMNLNKTPGVPHKGWQLKEVVDLRDEDLAYGEYADCQFCGQEQIRFVHILCHAQYSGDIRVGCMCAEQLTDDYVTPKRKESELRSRAGRRERWLRRKWNLSQKGH